MEHFGPTIGREADVMSFALSQDGKTNVDRSDEKTARPWCIESGMRLGGISLQDVKPDTVLMDQTSGIFLGDDTGTIVSGERKNVLRPQVDATSVKRLGLASSRERLLAVKNLRKFAVWHIHRASACRQHVSAWGHSSSGAKNCEL